MYNMKLVDIQTGQIKLDLDLVKSLYDEIETVREELEASEQYASNLYDCLYRCENWAYEAETHLDRFINEVMDMIEADQAKKLDHEELYAMSGDVSKAIQQIIDNIAKER